MPSISGKLLAGEARGAMLAVGARQRGSNYVYYGVMLGLLLIGGAAGGLVERMAGTAGKGWGAPLGLAAGGLAYLFVGRGLLLRRFRGAMEARGLSARMDYGLSIDDANLSLLSGVLTKIAPWTAVTEVFKAGDYWVFLVQMEPWFAPARFFAGRDEERAFLSEALSHMSPEARERSADAVRYVTF